MSWNSLAPVLRKDGLRDDLLLEAGVVGQIANQTSLHPPPRHHQHQQRMGLRAGQSAAISLLPRYSSPTLATQFCHRCITALPPQVRRPVRAGAGRVRESHRDTQTTRTDLPRDQGDPHQDPDGSEAAINGGSVPAVVVKRQVDPANQQNGEVKAFRSGADRRFMFRKG